MLPSWSLSDKFVQLLGRNTSEATKVISHGASDSWLINMILIMAAHVEVGPVSQGQAVRHFSPQTNSVYLHVSKTISSGVCSYDLTSSFAGCGLLRALSGLINGVSLGS